MYYAKNPFLTVGLPFISAVLAGTFVLVDLRKSRYTAKRNARTSGPSAASEAKRTMRTLEEELAEWEMVHRDRIGRDYDMKPSVPRLMSEVLRSPWILHSVLDDLSNDLSSQSGLNHLHRTPKLAQIIQFVRSSSDSTHILGHLSDKFHYIVGFFSDQSLGRFTSRHPNWSVNEIQGAIIRLMEYKIVKVPSSNGGSGGGDTVILVIEDFEHVGSDGSPAFGDPRYVPCNPGVLTALQRPAPPSPARKGAAPGSNAAYDWSFTQSLDPTDLLFLENTCTQTFQKQSVSFPLVVSDLDWRIPLDQERILAGVELLSVAEYEYSDVELSSDTGGEEEVRDMKRTKEETIVFPLTQSGADITATQSAQMSQAATAAMTQAPMHRFPMTQAPMTQAPMTQELFVPQSPLKSPQRSAMTPVIFAETQVTADSPVRIAGTFPVPPSSPLLHNSEMLSPPRKLQIPADVRMSSPINSPIKPGALRLSSPIKQQSQSQPPPVMEYPDYSSW